MFPCVAPRDLLRSMTVPQKEPPQQSPRRRLGVRHEMLLLVILAVVPSVAVVVYFGFERFQQQIGETVQTSQAALREVGWIQELKLAETRTVLESLGTFSEIRACLPEASTEILRQQVEYNPRHH